MIRITFETPDGIKVSYEDTLRDIMHSKDVPMRMEALFDQAKQFIKEEREKRKNENIT